MSMPHFPIGILQYVDELYNDHLIIDQLGSNFFEFSFIHLFAGQQIFLMTETEYNTRIYAKLPI